MTVRKLYSYIFYKLYKFSEAAPSKWWSDWKATIALLTLELWLVISAFVYYAIVAQKGLPGDDTIVLAGSAVIGILVLIKYLIFYRHDRWRTYVSEFDKWSKKQNKTGTILVCLLVFFIIGNLIFSFYLLSQNN